MDIPSSPICLDAIGSMCRCHFRNVTRLNCDGSVKNPLSALRLIFRHCGVPQVRLNPKTSVLFPGIIRGVSRNQQLPRGTGKSRISVSFLRAAGPLQTTGQGGDQQQGTGKKWSCPSRRRHAGLRRLMHGIDRVTNDMAEQVKDFRGRRRHLVGIAAVR